MNLTNNLKKIRKDNNLSQEGLADKLGVSRQSVSKWESGTAYPEMDKMIKLCELFDLNIDELLNQDISKIKESKQSKNNINKFIDDFLSYFTKTIDMFTNMNFKQIIKCLFEIIMSALLITIVLSILGLVSGTIVHSFLQILPYDIYITIYNILEGIYGIIALIFGIILLLHIFKVRYLDYYEIVKEEPTEDIQNNKKTIIEKEGQKIIIRDPKHSSNSFISALLKFFLICIKIFIGFIALNFCFSLIFFVVCLVLSFVIAKTGLLFIGILLGLLGGIQINIIILIILYNFIISKKNNLKLIGINLISGLILIGIGIGLSLIAIKDFNIVDYNNPKYFIKDEKTFKAGDISFIHDNVNIDIIESNNNDIKVEIIHNKYNNIELKLDENNALYYHTYPTYNNVMDIIRLQLDAFNDKKILNIDDYDIKIYTSKETIDQMEENKNNY